MADIYYIRIGKVDETRVVLHCLTGFTADGTNYETSRSFALSVLLDTKLHADDYEYLASDEDMQRLKPLAECAASAPSPLHDELPNAEPWEAEWPKTNVPRFITSTKVLARRNVRSADDASIVMGVVVELGATPRLIEAGWQRLHNWDLEVELTDAKWASHLVEGQLFATASFDAWQE